MKKLKHILIMSIVLAMLVPMAVFAQGTKFVNLQIDAKTYGSLNISNRGRASSIAGSKFEMFIPNPGNYKDTTENLEIQKTAIIQGKTTITLNLSPNTEYGLRVFQIKEKKSNTVLVLGPEVADAAKNNIKMDEGPNTLPKDVSVELAQDGEYVLELFVSNETGGGTGRSYIKIENGEQPKSDLSKPSVTKPVVNKLGATPTSSKVLVDKVPVAFEAYTIENNNYIKLRDFAYAVTGTKKQFDVGWDAKKRAINLLSNAPYSANGTELGKGDGKAKAPVLNKAKIYQNGKEVSLKAYTIADNNYFKLRDLAGAFNIQVTWDAGTSTIGIETGGKIVK